MLAGLRRGSSDIWVLDNATDGTRWVAGCFGSRIPRFCSSACREDDGLACFFLSWNASGRKGIVGLAPITDEGGRAQQGSGRIRERHPVRMALQSMKDGLRTLFAESPVIRMSVLLSMCVLMVIGGYQGLILPVHFTIEGRADLLVYVLTVMSAGVLAASLIYAKLAPRLSNRAWYSLSLVGMMAGIAVMATLPSYPVLLAGAALLGFASGPLSALLNFKVFDLIPDEVRGTTLGTQNALMLVVAPVAVLIASVLVTWLGVGLAAIVLAGLWAAFTLYSLLSSLMREL